MKKETILLILMLLTSILSWAQNVTSLDTYLNNKLDYVTNVTSEGSILTISGFPTRSNDASVETRKVQLTRYQVFSQTEYGVFWRGNHWQKLPIGLITVPFKLRPAANGNKAVAQAGLANVGLNVDLFQAVLNRYFSNGKKSVSRFGIGLFLAPSVEELDSIATNGFLVGSAKSKQFFLSSGLTISYSYSGISFVVVPAGFDFGTSEIGKKWVYNNSYWWGFGVGITPQLFTQIANK